MGSLRRSFSVPIPSSMGRIRSLVAHLDFETHVVRRAGMRLRHIWEGNSNNGEAKRALERYLICGLAGHVIGHRDVADLCVTLADEASPGTCRIAGLESWVDAHLDN